MMEREFRKLSLAEYAYACAMLYVAGVVFAALSNNAYLSEAGTLAEALFPGTLRGEVAFLLLSCLGYSGVVMSFLRGAGNSMLLSGIFSDLLLGQAPELSLLITSSAGLVLGLLLSATAGAFALALWQRSFGKAGTALSIYALLALAELHIPYVLNSLYKSSFFCWWLR